MTEEAGYTRFFVMLDVMTALLLTMAAAGDLITLLIAWHLIGVVLWFLLGTDVKSHSAWRYGFWTFITHRLGDLPLVMAAVLLFNAYDSWSLPVIFERIAADPDKPTWFGLSTAEAAGALLALAAFARSAQFLSHPWLPYSMAGPTPVSAFMHAGVVNAGGFLLNRFAPVFVHTDGVLHWVFAVGLTTAVIGSVSMLVQNDVKKSLGYSTMGQMGFMMMECGVGAFALAMFHLVAHGFFKATLFLNAGAAIAAARADDGAPKEDLYTFVVERRPPSSGPPWLIMAAVTVIAPIAILLLSHWVLAWAAPESPQKQGAVVLLLFAWITGAQLLFSTVRAVSQNPWASLRRSLGWVMVSFIVVVVGWAFIGHAFERFLYPQAGFAARLYAAAEINTVLFAAIVAVAAAVIAVGWTRVYYTDRRGGAGRDSGLWPGVYVLLAREFYVNEAYAGFGRAILAASARVNAWLRWG